MICDRLHPGSACRGCWVLPVSHRSRSGNPVPPKHSDRSVIVEVDRLPSAPPVGATTPVHGVRRPASMFKSAAQLRSENIALRHQLAVLRRSAPSRLKLTKTLETETQEQVHRPGSHVTRLTRSSTSNRRASHPRNSVESRYAEHSRIAKSPRDVGNGVPGSSVSERVHRSSGDAGWVSNLHARTTGETDSVAGCVGPNQQSSETP